VKSKKRAKKDWFSQLTRLVTIIGGSLSILITLFLVLLIFGVLPSPSGGGLGKGNVAVLSIEGPLVVSGESMFGGGFTTSNNIIGILKELDEDQKIDALILDINSPGGSAVASDEMGRAIKNFSKPVIAVIREVGASGGYWIASASDHIIANRMSMTGSIGVIGSGFGIEGLMDDYNVTYRRHVSGKYKDAGSPFRAMTIDEEELIQALLDDIYEEFVLEVAQNRNMPYEEVEELATGFVYLGKEAKDLGLVDELGGMDEAKAYMEKELNATVELAKFEQPPSLIDLFAGVINENFYALGQGLGKSMQLKRSFSFALE